MSLRWAAALALAWAIPALALHLAHGRDHVAVLAGATGSSWQLALGEATVITHLVGVFVVAPCVVAALLGAAVDRLTRR
jgi:hypothetical protein